MIGNRKFYAEGSTVGFCRKYLIFEPDFFDRKCRLFRAIYTAILGLFHRDCNGVHLIFFIITPLNEKV